MKTLVDLEWITNGKFGVFCLIAVQRQRKGEEICDDTKLEFPLPDWNETCSYEQ